MGNTSGTRWFAYEATCFFCRKNYKFISEEKIKVRDKPSIIGQICPKCKMPVLISDGLYSEGMFQSNNSVWFENTERIKSFQRWIKVEEKIKKFLEDETTKAVKSVETNNSKTELNKDELVAYMDEVFHIESYILGLFYNCVRVSYDNDVFEQDLQYKNNIEKKNWKETKNRLLNEIENTKDGLFDAESGFVAPIKPSVEDINKPQKPKSVDDVIVPEKPTEPVYAEPSGIFKRKKIMALNDELKKEYEEKLTEYNNAVNKHESYIKYQRDMEEYEKLMAEYECEYDIAVKKHEIAMEEYKALLKQYRQSVRDYRKQRITQIQTRIDKTESDGFCADSTIAQLNEYSSLECNLLKEEIKEALIRLQNLYAKNCIFPKYRNIIAVSTILEYLKSGRCSCLEGEAGAYNTYEIEARSNEIIASLNDVRECFSFNYSQTSLQRFHDHQYLLYMDLQKIIEWFAKAEKTLKKTYESIHKSQKQAEKILQDVSKGKSKFSRERDAYKENIFSGTV